MPILFHLKQKPLKIVLFILCLATIFFVSGKTCAQQAKQTSATKHCLWSVQTPQNKTFFLLGSLHVLRNDAYPLSNVIYEAYRRCEKVVFETDLAAMMDPANQAKMVSMGLYPEGQTLFRSISDEMQISLEKKLKTLGMPIQQFERFRPWFIAATLTALELQRLGFRPEYGIDVHFYRRAGSDQKEIGYFESVDVQLELLAKMSEHDQKAFLGQTLKDLDIAAQMADDLMHSWKKGDSDNLYKILSTSFEGYPQIEKRLLRWRNIDWVKKIEELMAENKNVFIVVGAGHLIGPGSVVALLKERGYPIKQK